MFLYIESKLFYMKTLGEKMTNLPANFSPSGGGRRGTATL